MMLLLDTNVASAVMHRLPGAMTRLQATIPSEVVLCSPVAAEIAFGLARLAEGSRRRQLLENEYVRLHDAVVWWDWTEPAATEFGIQKALLERRGLPIEDMDVIIGSIALVNGASVATYNARHLGRIEGLTVDDWNEP